MDFFRQPIKKREKLLTIFASFSIIFTYLCLRQIYGDFSPHLLPAFDLCKKQIDVCFFMRLSSY